MNWTLMNDGRSWCELRAHDRIIRYRCAGAGRSVLVLATAEASPFWAVLMSGLDGRFRVIAPEPPAEDTDLTGWLASLLEGLGTAGIRVIAGDRFHASALRIVHGDPDQVACVVLVSEGTDPKDTAPGTGIIPEIDTVVPVLAVDATKPAADLAAWVKAFLLRESPAATS